MTRARTMVPISLVEQEVALRAVVSGTHGSGKSTLIGDFAMSHREWEVLPDPFEDIDAAAEPDAALFLRQLRIAAERLLEPATGPVIAERGPLDFLAYLDALDALGRRSSALELLERGRRLTARAMDGVDLLILLPLTATDPIEVGAEEDPELREAMDLALLELADDPDLTGGARVVEITGDRARRLRRLEDAIENSS